MTASGPPRGARALLGPDGPLAKRLPGYEAREPQLVMADGVERALAGDRTLLCEAGTGTGKTLAYLVPALLSGRNVVVATATKALQEQIFFKDLPLLASHAGLEVDALLVKGLPNYLCRRKYAEFTQSADAAAHGATLAAVDRWLETTETGDLSEVAALGETGRVRLEIAASSETRIGPACVHFERCYVTKLKRQAERAKLLVVNHHLLFADLALKGNHPGGALPPYDTVIFDEAHRLEDIAADFFGARVSAARLASLHRDAERAFRHAGFGDRLLAKVDVALLLGQLGDATDIFFRALTRYGTPDGTKQPLRATSWPDDLKHAYGRLDAALEALEGFADAHPVTEAIELLARRVPALRGDLQVVVESAEHQVAWIETTGKTVTVGCTPIDVAELLRTKMFSRMSSAVLTSATLAVGSGFSFLRRRLGLDNVEAPVDELTLASPFDVEQHALLYVPRDLPDVARAEPDDTVAQRVADLVASAQGGAFVLCTSVRSMRRLHAFLRHAKVSGLLLQGESPKRMLLDQFRANQNAVLVATMSFWEGVDVPGHALRLVILDKIPFPVPTDPVVAARCQALEAEGRNPFMEYFVPAAALTLKQGFGRLLRTTTDRGVVAILDRRMVTRGYGRQLFAALPPARRTERIDDVRAFFRATA